MTDRLEIDVRAPRFPCEFTLAAPGPFTFEQLEIAMAICSRYFGGSASPPPTTQD